MSHNTRGHALPNQPSRNRPTGRNNASRPNLLPRSHTSPAKLGPASAFLFVRQTNRPRSVCHASLIERPDAPSDQHAVPAMSDDDQGPLMRGSVAAALFSATAFTAARVYCSVTVLNRTRREDIIIVLSLVGDGRLFFPSSEAGPT